MAQCAQQSSVNSTEPSKSLVTFIRKLRWEELDTEVRQAARWHLLDTVGIMVSGCSGEVAGRLEDVLSSLRADGTVPVPGRARRADRLDAVYIGGTGAHGIEFDDGYRQGAVHPGVVVVPALLSMAYGRDVGGPQLLEAVVAGYETVTAVARTCHPALRRRGFHPTAVVGPLGSAMASGKLLDLDAVSLEAALGLAASASAGLFAFLGGGGDVKRLHAGHAGREGLTAALLASHGVLGPPRVLEAMDGFFQAFAFGPGELDVSLVFPPDGPLGITDCYIKPYPCCRHLHPALEALIELMSDHGLKEADVRSIDVETYAIAAEHAHTGWDDVASAQLSFPYIMALGVRHGTISLEHFESDALLDPDLADICRRVRVNVDPDLDRSYPELRPARVTLTTPNGTFSRQNSEALGSRLMPLDDIRLEKKFLSLTEPVLGEGSARRLLDALLHVETEKDVSSILDLAALPTTIKRR